MVALVKEKLEQQLHYPYLSKQVPTNWIDEDRILFSTEMLEQSSEETVHITVPMMLVQTALDIHDEVTDSDDSSALRPLTVLKGDLYSGMYYRYLASQNNIPMIRVLAEAIKTINEQKIRLHRQDITSANDFFETITIIESALLVNIANYYQLSDWTLPIRSFFSLRRLQRMESPFKMDKYEGICKETLIKFIERNPKSTLTDRMMEVANDRVEGTTSP